MHTPHSPMFSVTVMMFRDMVESVMLLKDDDCKTEVKHEMTSCALITFPVPQLPPLCALTLSVAPQPSPTIPALC